jgi:integrase/recombinase XerD
MRAKLMTTALRSFLRYARYRGDITLDLAAAVPAVANWSMPAIPRAISPKQTRQLLASIDRRSGIGRRDYAILLLLAHLGLRSGEVASLELDDIDWSEGRLMVRGAQRNELPLPVDVGEAIAAYLCNGRPPSTYRRVFLRAKAQGHIQSLPLVAAEAGHRPLLEAHNGHGPSASGRSSLRDRVMART